MHSNTSQDEKYRMMTEAPIPGLIGRLAVPTIISMLITSFYNMADTFFVGRIGTSATAAVGVAFPLMASGAGLFLRTRVGEFYFQKAWF